MRQYKQFMIWRISSYFNVENNKMRRKKKVKIKDITIKTNLSISFYVIE